MMFLNFRDKETGTEGSTPDRSHEAQTDASADPESAADILAEEHDFNDDDASPLRLPRAAEWTPAQDEQDFARLTTNEDWCIAFYKTGIYKRVHLIHKMNNMPVAADSFFVEKIVADNTEVWALFCQKHGQMHDQTPVESDPYLLDCFETADVAMERVKWLTETMIREIDTRLRMLWGKPIAAPSSEDTSKPQVQMADAEAPLKNEGRTVTWLQIFPTEEIAKAKASWANDDAKKKGQALVAAMSQYGGMRMVPSFPEELSKLLKKFPHFKEVIEHIESELFLSTLLSPDKFYFQPILVNGDPGIGKTYFLESLAALMGVPFFKISCGSVNGGFEITGTSQHWRNPTPGKIFTALSTTAYATPIILLDEIDKIRNSGEFPVEPAFLDILEPRTAAKFRDEAAVANFDASHCIFVASSNDDASILPALLSRFRQFDVPLPSVDENRAIFGEAFREMVEQFGVSDKLALPETVLQKIASSRMAPRAIIHQLRRQIGTALKTGESDVNFTPDVPERSIGF